MFYLVGSRFFQTHREDSDIDLIANDTPENRAFLVSKGLECYSNDPVRYVGFGYDVALFPDVKPYVDARDKLGKAPGVHNLTKRERHRVLSKIVKRNLQEMTYGMVE